MTVHIISPFRQDKNLGKAYNEAMQLVPDGDWVCLKDMDTCFLTPDAGNILLQYIELYGKDTALFTCFTNRISTLSHMQLLGGKVSENSDIRTHIKLAEQQKKRLYSTTVIPGTISGMLMLLSKEQWKEMPFVENDQCLGVDTEYSRRLHANGKKILRMDGLYLFHSYRLMNGIYSKKHLA
jgi:GT2 family glycosyltransferase